MSKVDNADRFFAAVITIGFIFILGVVVCGIIQAFLSSPVWTVVILFSIRWLFSKIYPRIIRSMESGSF